MATTTHPSNPQPPPTMRPGPTLMDLPREIHMQILTYILLIKTPILPICPCCPPSLPSEPPPTNNSATPSPFEIHTTGAIHPATSLSHTSHYFHTAIQTQRAHLIKTCKSLRKEDPDLLRPTLHLTTLKPGTIIARWIYPLLLPLSSPPSSDKDNSIPKIPNLKIHIQLAGLHPAQQDAENPEEGPDVPIDLNPHGVEELAFRMNGVNYPMTRVLHALLHNGDVLANVIMRLVATGTTNIASPSSSTKHNMRDAQATPWKLHIGRLVLDVVRPDAFNPCLTCRESPDAWPPSQGKPMARKMYKAWLVYKRAHRGRYINCLGSMVEGLVGGFEEVFRERGESGVKEVILFKLGLAKVDGVLRKDLRKGRKWILNGEVGEARDGAEVRGVKRKMEEMEGEENEGGVVRVVGSG